MIYSIHYFTLLSSIFLLVYKDIFVIYALNRKDNTDARAEGLCICIYIF